MTGIDKALDLIIALDVTDRYDSSKVKPFLNALLGSYKISQSETNVGIVTYGSVANETLPISHGTDLSVIQQRVDTAQTLVGPRKASEALIMARLFFHDSLRSEKAKGERKQIILVAMGDNDKSDSQSFAKIMSQLEEDYVDVIILAIKTKDDSEFKKSLKSQDGLIKADDTNSLKNVFGILESRSRKATGILIIFNGL